MLRRGQQPGEIPLEQLVSHESVLFNAQPAQPGGLCAFVNAELGKRVCEGGARGVG